MDDGAACGFVGVEEGFDQLDEDDDGRLELDDELRLEDELEELRLDEPDDFASTWEPKQRTAKARTFINDFMM